MKAYKLTRRKGVSPVVVVNVEDAVFEKPKIPCTLITKVHGIPKFTPDPVVLQGAVSHRPLPGVRLEASRHPAVRLEASRHPAQVRLERRASHSHSQPHSAG